ncbi:hypothetical protein GPK34_11295 [Secundilactobacillus kimchicus]|uniref:Uncharacterized protein n=1 Tax=Secundilactobacillus kimchicus JCM 15530 TaxID=1302272 RepID=A0A0R1HLV5_9LACO|nr:hypothetical protein [Secundilactobacillus kimchicus]KRK47725.1 hypothetical protein FC96_GL002210 [Secundilactobacillus kimchicus JCM 15530]MBT9672610.1 hypothetical protein [Secundilactobacillus kimchicus]
MELNGITINCNNRGALTQLKWGNDATQMNWVIDPAYLAEVGYQDDDKLFGEFTVAIDGQSYQSIDFPTQIDQTADQLTVTTTIQDLVFKSHYTAAPNQVLNWQFSVSNPSQRPVTLTNLGVWTSLAYVMYRDKNVRRNAQESAAVFPSISKNYTKLAVMRRDDEHQNLGLYQTAGEVLSVGTYCEYNNRFFENVSPSLDGMLFHQLILAGGYPADNGPKHDWIYPQTVLNLAAGETRQWAFNACLFNDQADFYQTGATFGHPEIHFAPMVSNAAQQLSLDAESAQKVASICDVTMTAAGLKKRELKSLLTDTTVTYQPEGEGEHQVIVTFDDGTQDMLVYNYLASIRRLLQDRVDYVSQHSYSGATGQHPYAFEPVSNQGESLGKMTFVLQACLLDPDIDQVAEKIQQVELSAVHYVKNKWFIDGDLSRPAKLYGDFYRVMDLEYIGHLFFLLSQSDAQYLKLNKPATYLKWAAKICDLRVNPALHDNVRAKEETQMLGQFFLYINDLLSALKAADLTKEYQEISTSWQNMITSVAAGADKLTAAVTEHFYDNAGFGPAAAALAQAEQPAAQVYGHLLQANIGFSNDFRAQSPDRWWEALSYMIHSLWGGVTAAAALITGHRLGDAHLVEAAYRATVGVLYMYDSNATATDRQLQPGEAASTYSIAGPNLNRPDLSRNRFGQSVFAADGGIFSRLFPDGYTGEDDWDMGEELVAYLNGFGQQTYIYQDETDGYHVVNGEVTDQTGHVLTIRSTAPYPSQYIDLNHQTVFHSPEVVVHYDVTTDTFMA